MRVRLKIYRKKPGERARTDEYEVDVDPDTSVLDVLEEISLRQDPSLTFNHACHHGVCGACGMVINGVERLACITKIGEVARNGVVTIEPLKGFDVISDLYVDYGEMFRKIGRVKPLSLVSEGELRVKNVPSYVSNPRAKLDDCIECGICYSACPIANTSEEYLGPAAIALAYRAEAFRKDEERIRLVNSFYGVWSCHVAFECSNLCPVGFNPGEMIMKLRKSLLLRDLLSLLRRR